MTELSLNEIKENIMSVSSRVEQAALKVGRKLNDIHLVAATKMNDAEKVQAAIQSGIKIVGENKVQELLDKYEQHAYDGAKLHFIGNLQTNKVKYLIGKVDMIESVGSERLAMVIDKEAKKIGIVQDILLEVNIGEESAKGGFNPADLQDSIETLSTFSNIRIRGLMAIPPIQELQGENLCYFNRMRQLFIDISQKKYDNISMDYLSMGMSGDFEDAISCGANIVRVGSSIFGMRPYKR